MRTDSVEGVVVNYPDEVVAVFGRNPIEITKFTGTSVVLEVTGGGNTVKDKRAPFGEMCFFDLAYYMQVLFDTSDLGNVDYDSNVSDSGLSRTFNVSLEFFDGSSSIGTIEFSLVGVWASVLPTSVQTLVRFIGYPFTATLLTPSKSVINYDGLTYNAPAESVNFPVHTSYNADVVLTTAEQTITIKPVTGCDGIYLRWIDVYGRYCYWLFRKGDVKTGVEDAGVIKRRNTGTDFGTRRTEKKVKQSVEVCAPLVDGETFDFLLGVAASPVVDMYADGEWVSVNVDGGDIVRERSELQDFIINVSLSDLIVQRL